MGIGEKIKYLVDTFEGGNKSNLARKIGIPNGKPALIRDWIIGRSRPKAEYRRAIVDAYAANGVTLDWLASDTDCPPVARGIASRAEGAYLIERVSTMDKEKLNAYMVTLKMDTGKTIGSGIVGRPTIQLDVMAENSRDAGVIAQEAAFINFGAEYRITDVIVDRASENFDGRAAGGGNNPTTDQKLNSIMKCMENMNMDILELKNKANFTPANTAMPELWA